MAARSLKEEPDAGPPLEVRLREAGPGDLETLVACNRLLALESEARELDPAVLREGVRRALEDPGLGRYLLAEAEGRVVGQLMVTREWSDWRGGWFWWIQSVFVLPEYRRRGVYGSLHRRVEELARAAGDVRGLRLYVERSNATALAAYLCLGMAESGYLLLERDWSAATRRGEDG